MGVNLYLIWPLLLAALVPLALIATRNELRKVRYRLVAELRTHLFKGVAGLPQLELAEARYRAENDAAGETRQSLVRIWTGALIFIAISFVGFSLLLVPRAALLSPVADFPRITNALLWGAQSPVAPYDDLARTVTVLAVAFLGGYVFQIRYLMRATLNQELGALAFVRATIYLVQGMIVALIAYRATIAIATPQPSGGTFAAALAVAFVLGFFPNIGLTRIAKLAGIPRKEVNNEMLAASKIIPLEVIDGIDAETAYRLEESNLIDVQNLATINPISLYAETPFTLLEVFDWVLQAQLCVNVGPDAFLALRQHKIRTIFDLERAVLAEGAPDDYVRAIGAVIFDTASAGFRLRVGLGAGDAPVANVQISVATVRHAAAILCDDLHVHRLRALWRIMLKTTAGVGEADSPWLYETGVLPGDACFAETPLKAPAGALVSLAAHYGGEYAALAAAPAPAAALTAKRTEALDAVRRAVAADPAARERLRRLWSPTYLRKRSDEGSLEPFFADADFQRLLAPCALASAGGLTPCPLPRRRAGGAQQAG